LILIMDRVLSTTSAADAGSNASTWSEMIKQVEASKKTLPWNNGDFVPAKRIPLPERKAMERKLDPITMKLRDEKSESAYTQKKMERTTANVLSRYNDIKNTEYNIVSHVGPPRNYEKIVAEVKELQGKPARNYNLFSHLEHSKQTTCPILYNKEYMDKYRAPSRSTFVPPTSEREFNIISNEYSSDNSTMLKNEYNKMKNDMTKKYWETHDYNPITVQYYDDDKEIKIRAKEIASKATHGSKNDDKLPDCYRYSEGKAYNILTLDVKNDDMIKRALRTEVKKDNRLNKYKGFPQKQVAAGVAAYEKSREQSMARVGYEKWEQEIKRGYDFVSTGPAISATHKPMPDPKKTAWEKVQDKEFVANYDLNKSDVLASTHGAVPRQTATVTTKSNRSGNSPTTHGNEGGMITSATPRTNAMLNAQVDSARFSARNPDSARILSARDSARFGGGGGNSGSARAIIQRVPSLDLTAPGAKVSSMPSVRTGGGLGSGYQ
jgi:hypothetical protein